MINFYSFVKIDRLENSVRIKEEELSTERTRHQSNVTMYVSQLRDLRVDYEDKIKEYENLMDIKVALDQEIATYRSLLEEEEDRYGLIVCDPSCMSFDPDLS